jgi:conjugal transfer pilin signal peptidase TrbI
MPRRERLIERPRALFGRHRTRWTTGLAVVGLVGVLSALLYGSARYRLGVDTQDQVSLAPYRVFLVDTWQGAADIIQGDLVAFRARGLAPYFRDGQLLIKRAAGVPGDWVTVIPGTPGSMGAGWPMAWRWPRP